MDLLQLRYFQEVAYSQHLTKSAEKLMISRPSLSAAISRLEHELGIQLFDRKGRGIQLNEHGKVFLNYVDEILGTLDHAICDMSERAGKIQTKLRIALTSLPIYRSFLENYKLQNPDLDLQYHEVPLSATLTPTGTPDFDFFLGVTRDLDLSFFDYEKTFPTEMPYVVMSVKHRFASYPAIDFFDLHNETFLTLGHFNESAHKWTMDFCAAAGFKPKKILEYSYFYREKALIDNVGICVTTNLGKSKNYLNTPMVAKIPVINPQITRNQCIAWKKGMYLSKTHLAFKEALINDCMNYKF